MMINANQVSGEAPPSSAHWQMRFYFYQKKFGQVWNCLQQAGWFYRAPNYVSPDGRVFGSSNEVCAYVDEAGLPEVYSNLQSTADHTVNKDDPVLQIRHRILQEWEIKYGIPNKQDGTEHADDLSAIFDATSATDYASSMKSILNSQSTISQQMMSTTVADKGSDMYLHRATRGRKVRTKRSTATSTTTTLTVPLVQDCIRATKAYKTDNNVHEREDALTASFDEWRFLLSTNHNLLFYGVGSKRVLLERFAKESLEHEGNTVILDACDKGISIQGILDVLIMLFLRNKEPETSSIMALEDKFHIPIVGESTPWRTSSVQERAILTGRAIAERALESYQPVFLVIHNIEGLNQTAQDCLGYLVVNSRVPNAVHAIRIVASVDHVDAMFLLWKPPTACNLAWIYRQVHTERPYMNELLLIPEEVSKRKAQAIQMKHDMRDAVVADVLKSLTPRHGEILQCLARLQQKDDWVAYKDLRHETRQAALIASDSQLKAVLVELSEHGMVESATGGSTETLRIPYSTNKVREILMLRFRA